VPSYTTADIRNIALVGHAASGKTTLAEALLHAAGAVNAPGEVEKGSTASDYDPQEKKYQHSLNASILCLDHRGAHINLIDTPGYPDFLGQALSILPAVETVAVLINAQAGIEATTRQLMEWAADRHLCRMIVVNKIDADELNLPALLDDITETFGKECLPVNLPAHGRADVVDCFFNPAGDSDFSSVADAHTALVDQVVEVDEELMALYLEQGEVSPQQLHEPLEEALREGHLIPVCFTSARSGAGVKELLDVFARLMPNPAEGNPPPFIKQEGDKAKEVHAEPDPGQHVLAHVCKVELDPFVGKLGIFRIHQGTVTKDSQLYIGDARKAFKVGHLLKLQGKQHNETNKCIPGDICAVAKVDDIHFDAVLHDSHDEDHIHLRRIDLPTPMVGLAIQAKTRSDEQKLSDVLHRLVDEEPCLVVERNNAGNETVMRGLGDLHLRIVLERMQERYNVEVDTHPPSIAYRETITANAEGHYRHKKQTGGAGQFGEVFLRIEPLERGAGFEFVNQITGGAIPAGYLPAIEKGVRQALDSGAIAGYPMQDVRVIVYDGKYHTVDSNEVSFVTAGRKAFLDAARKARPIVLEPIAEIEITAPNAKVGDITGDLSSRRGRISRTDAVAGERISIAGQVPLAEMTDYQSHLKSMTGGEGAYSMQFGHYDPVPPNIQKQLMAAYKPGADAD